MNASKYANMTVNVCGIILSSIYLTFIIDTYTLNTWPKRVFVFCYFLVMCCAALFLKKKLRQGNAFPAYMLAVIAVLSAVIVVWGHNTFLPKVQKSTVSLAVVSCEDGSYHEVWLSSVQADGSDIQLSTIELDANQGWTYSADSDDYVFYPAEGGNMENYLTFTVTGKSIVLRFGQNAWSGAVNIRINDADAAVLSLTTESSGVAEYAIESVKSYAAWETILYGVGACLVVGYFLQMLFIAVSRWTGLRLSWTRRQMLLAGLIAANTALLFFTSDKIHPTLLTRVFLVLLTGLAAAKWLAAARGTCMEKYCSRGCYGVIAAISFYASLVSFGQRFFLDGNTRIHFSAQGVLYCICGTLWFIPIVWLLLFALEWLSSRERCLPNPETRRKACRKLFGILAACQAVILWILWPGGFPVDSINQLSQIAGYYGYNDWHPLLHTLLEKAILTIIPTAGAITAVQMLLFVILLTSFLMLGYDRGISLVKLAVLGCLFLLLPNQALSWSNVLKDFPFTLALLWGMYLLALLAIDVQKSRKVYFWALFALDLFLIMGLRHNGIVPAAVMILLVIVLTFRDFQRFRLRAVAAAAAAVLAFAMFKGPVFRLLNVGANGMSPYTTMLCAVGSCINKDLPLSPESTAIMEKVLPLEDWRDYYNRYQGHDQYYWGRPAGSEPYDTSSITAREAFSVYFEALRKYPDVVIKDRLDGMDLMWDVAQPADSFNFKSFDFVNPFDASAIPMPTAGLTQREDGSFVKETFLARLYYASENTPINSAADMLLWRTGAYIIALLLLFVFWWKNHMGRLLWAALPMLGNMAGSMLVLYHQSFRYVYFIQPGVMALIFLSVIFEGEKELSKTAQQSPNNQPL